MSRQSENSPSSRRLEENDPQQNACHKQSHFHSIQSQEDFIWWHTAWQQNLGNIEERSDGRQLLAKDLVRKWFSDFYFVWIISFCLEYTHRVWEKNAWGVKKGTEQKKYKLRKTHFKWTAHDISINCPRIKRNGRHINQRGLEIPEFEADWLLWV